MEEFPQFTENEDVQGFTSMFFPTTDLPITTTMLPDNSTLHCNSFRKNSTTPIVINAGYGGIPQNLLINFVAWTVIQCFHYIQFTGKLKENHFLPVFNHAVFSAAKKCLELWSDGTTTTKRKKV